MNVTQDVVTDLLPAYVSGEASADTRTLVDEFLKANPSFASIMDATRRGLGEPLLAREPALPADVEKEAVSRTRGVIRRLRRLFVFATILTLLPLSFTFGREGVHFLLQQEPKAAAFWVPASMLWFIYFRTQRRLKGAGL